MLNIHTKLRDDYSNSLNLSEDTHTHTQIKRQFFLRFLLLFYSKEIRLTKKTREVKLLLAYHMQFFICSCGLHNELSSRVTYVKPPTKPLKNVSFYLIFWNIL